MKFKYCLNFEASYFYTEQNDNSSKYNVDRATKYSNQLICHVQEYVVQIYYIYEQTINMTGFIKGVNSPLNLNNSLMVYWNDSK